MKKYKDELFKIGEVSKILGVTRKAILVYEEMSLLTPALCIYYRGPYEGIITVIRALAEYTKENHIEITGAFRSIYLEGPPSRGNNSADYITQIAVPIKV